MRNWRQRRCRFCGSRGGDYGAHAGQCISKEELYALTEFAIQNGVQWRSKLRRAWLLEQPILRELRNRVGPSRLDLIKPPVRKRSP